MSGYGTVATFLLLGIGFALWLVDPRYAPGIVSLYNAIGELDINAIVNIILGALSNSAVLATAGAALLTSLVVGQTVRYSFGAAILIVATNVLFLPFSFTRGFDIGGIVISGIPAIQAIVVIFFNLLLFLAVLEFITEKQW